VQALVPLIVYFAVRPFVHSDAAGLAVAYAPSRPPGPSRFVLDAYESTWWAVLTSVGFALGCIASLLAYWSSCR
jgi:hypothetical protein